MLASVPLGNELQKRKEKFNALTIITILKFTGILSERWLFSEFVWECQFKIALWECCCHALLNSLFASHYLHHPRKGQIFSDNGVLGLCHIWCLRHYAWI